MAEQSLASPRNAEQAQLSEVWRDVGEQFKAGLARRSLAERSEYRRVGVQQAKQGTDRNGAAKTGNPSRQGGARSGLARRDKRPKASSTERARRGGAKTRKARRAE